jgi:phospholipid-binding lipoprotein MlaA
MQKISCYKSVLGSLLLSWVVSGCATPPTHNPDPFEKFNRGVFAFNDGVDQMVIKPIAKTYKTIVPSPIDNGVTNFFSNIDDIVVVVNDLFQLKFKQAASDTGRLLVNSTVGLLGFIDVATDIGLPKHDEDFGQTLGYWGVNSGPYLVLPILGPSSARDAVGVGTDLLFDPTFYYAASPTTEAGQAILAGGAVRGVDKRADLLGLEKLLQTAALDKYAYFRDAYLARREYLVYDGDPPQTDEDEEEALFDDEDDEDEGFFQDDGDEEEDENEEVLLNEDEENEEELLSEEDEDDIAEGENDEDNLTEAEQNTIIDNDTAAPEG